LIRAPAPVRKVLFILGLGDLLPLGEETMQIFDVLKQINPVNEQALRNARRFLLDLFRLLDQDADAAERNVEAIFDICRTYARLADIENELQKLLAGAGLDRRIAAALPTPAAALVGQIAPFVGAGRLLDVGCGAGRVAEAFAKGGREIQLTDIVNHNQTKLPFVPFDGLSLPFPSKAYDICLLISVLHHCEDPLRILREAVRVSRRRIIIREVVYLNEVNRRFNMFFDWFFNCIAPTGRGPAFNINSPEGWEQLFRDEGLSVVASQDLGLDQPTTPEYHWLYVLDIPRP
jgi:SAM-dependent methyltransferase